MSKHTGVQNMQEWAKCTSAISIDIGHTIMVDCFLEHLKAAPQPFSALLAMQSGDRYS